MRLAGNYAYVMNDRTIDNTNYPPAPWTVNGHGIMIFSFPSVRKSFLEWPSDISTQSFFFGRSLSGYYLAQYHSPLNPHDSLPWHEWGNIAALTRSSKGNGFWIDTMAVDSDTARFGGKVIWGLHKIPGNIHILPLKHGGEARLILPEGRIELSWKEWGPSFPLTLPLAFLTRIDGLLYRFTIRMRASFQFSRSEIKRRDIPAFTSLSPGTYWAVRFQQSEIRISAPHPVTLST